MEGLACTLSVNFSRRADPAIHKASTQVVVGLFHNIRSQLSLFYRDFHQNLRSQKREKPTLHSLNNK